MCLTMKYSEEELENMKVPDLRQLCKKHGIGQAGNKSDLVDRLVEFFKEGEGILSADDDEDMLDMEDSLKMNRLEALNLACQHAVCPARTST